MKFKIMSKIAAMMIIMGFAVGVNAQQTESDAVAALKDGVAKYQAKDYLAAIKSFEECVNIYDALDLSNSENRGTAASQITKAQYKYALSFYKQKKFDESIAQFQKLEELSKTYNDPDNEKKANLIIPQLYYFKGKQLAEEKNISGAIESYNKAIELKNNYFDPYFRLAEIYSDQKNDDLFEKNIEKAIETASKPDYKTAANKLAANYYLKSGADAVKTDKWGDAEKYFKESLNYQEADADIYYQFAIIYNKQSKWDEAIKAGNKALELMGASDTADAKIYYELGNAYYGKGDNEAACDAYSKANKGDFEEAATYQMKNVVKCQ